MKKAIKTVFQDEEGRHIRVTVCVRYRPLLPKPFRFYEIWPECNEKGEVYVPAPRLFFRIYDLFARSAGFWLLRTKSVKDSATYSLKRFTPVDAPAWWLKCVGIDACKKDRGAGIKIGVVDIDFRKGNGLDQVDVTSVPSRSGQAAVLSKENDWGHGEAVCRVLSDRSREAAFLAAAPGAQIIFIDASSSAGRIDSGRATAAILKLAVDEKVDLINLSWGNPKPDRNTLGAIKVANELGVTVVAAAGNDPVQKKPFFPARLPGCICVGALGRLDWGPADTYSGWWSKESATKGRLGTVPSVGQVYAWLESTCGDGLDAIAPGVGILIQKDGTISHDISGTSFASPLVAGTMAVVLSDNKVYSSLPRSIDRTNWVRQLFMSMCRPSGIASEYEGAGVPWIATRS